MKRWLTALFLPLLLMILTLPALAEEPTPTPGPFQSMLTPVPGVPTPMPEPFQLMLTPVPGVPTAKAGNMAPVSYVEMLIHSQTQQAEPLFAEVSGMWYRKPDSPETPLVGDAVYFHVDGTCALYDAAYDEVHADEIDTLTLRSTGVWAAAGDMLYVATEDELLTILVQVMNWPDWEYNEGLRIGEGAYLPTTPQAANVPFEEVIPAEIQGYLHDWYGDYVLEGYAELPDVGGKPLSFVLLRAEEGRKVICYAWNGTRWDMMNTWWGVPQGDWAQVGLTVRKEGVSGENSLWYDPAIHDYEFPDGPAVGVWTSNDETIQERVEYVWEDGNYAGFKLSHYGDDPLTMVDVLGGDLIFYNISSGYEGRMHYLLDRDARAVDFYDLPREMTDVRIMGESEPPLPESIKPDMMSKQPFLEKQDVALRPDQYTVYMGPGATYDALGTLDLQSPTESGAAQNSTKRAGKWVQVFGEYEGWLLIHYAESAERYHFGWITADALVPGQVIKLLRFHFGDIMSTDPHSPLTDDPLNSRTPLFTPTSSESVEIEYLAQLGENYSYVRVKENGKTWWGFMYTWTMGHG